MSTLLLLSLGPLSLQKKSSINLGKGTTIWCMLGDSLYRPISFHFTLFFQNKSTCQKDITWTSDIFNSCQHSKQVLHIPLSQKHEPFIPQTPLYTKITFSCKTGQALQNHFHFHIHSCVLLATSSNTFHSTHSSYPKPPLPTVTPFTVFTISVLNLCKLSSIERFRPFQNKLSIGKGPGNIKQAQKNLRPHWKLLHCPTRIQLKQVFHELLSLYLGTFSLRFVNKKCSVHC